LILYAWKNMVSNTELNRMLEVATVAARLAGQRAMELISMVHTNYKNGNEIVTEADGICQKIILDRIKENYPDHGFLAEEGTGGKLLKQAPRSSEPFWWVIDPIDGTNNYAHGLLSFCVSISVMYQGSPVVAAIFNPATESMFTAYSEGPAAVNNARISTTEENITKFASIAIDSHMENSQMSAVFNIAARTRFRNLGATALHLAYVAKGSFVALIATSPKLWDIAAGALIIQRAGGIVTDWQGNHIFPVDPTDYDGKKFDIIASNKTVHKELISNLKGF